MAAPELAALALLDRALAVAEQALLAEHPTLAGPPPANGHDAPPLACACRLLRAIRPLRRQLAAYRHAVRDHLLPAPEDDLPF